jgi:hypothetical protein
MDLINSRVDCELSQIVAMTRAIDDEHPIALVGVPRDIVASVDRSKPTINRYLKTDNYVPTPETSDFYFACASVRKSVWILVLQLRGPHLRTCA